MKGKKRATKSTENTIKDFYKGDKKEINKFTKTNKKVIERGY
jgi:hypothetical protein